MMEPFAKLIEAAGLTEWSHFLERRPQFADVEDAKALFMCGFAQGSAWAVTLTFADDAPEERRS